MNSEVEQRIVAMYFDNKDFEKNAKQTIDTLGELKENLDLEKSIKGFDELDKAGKKLNLSQARTTVRNLKDAVGGLSDGLKKAFDIGTAPLHSLDNFFNTFRGYVGKFLGFDLASKFVNSIESALRQLTIAPMEAGWSMYQANVDSTKTIMSGTLKTYKDQMSKTSSDWTYDEREHMEYVKGELEELSRYAQKTVFSLSDMTNNVGKFTNNNIPLEESVNAMEGIANMTAKAGQGAQQASMAMYNFSQALGVGKMTSIDWKSIENANIATGELKQTFIDTAVASGKLTKEVEKMADGTALERFYITVDKNGKKLAKKNWIEVSAENFRDSLSHGWLDKDTMMKTFQIYSNQVRDLDTLAAMGFDINDTELVEKLLAIGEEAEKAATQVRTFQKMWDAMTESVQSSWADSMQFIFGDMLEATEFWTTINDKIGAVLDEAGERRNNLLREWRGMVFNEKTNEWEKLEGAVDGRQDLIEGIYNVIDAAKELGGAFSRAWSEVFGNLSGKKLQELTKGFRDFTDRFKAWLGDINDGKSRIAKIKNGLTGVLNVLKLVATFIKTGFSLALNIIKPFIDPLLSLFNMFGSAVNLSGAKSLGDMLTTLKTKFQNLWTEIKNLGVGGLFAKIGDKFKEIMKKIRDSISNYLDENGLTEVKDWFINLGDRIKEGWDKITAFFKPVQIQGKMGNVYEGDAPVVTFFKNMLENLGVSWESIRDWKGWKEISNFFTGIWDTLTGLFKPKKGTPIYDGTGRHETYEDSPIVAFFKGAWKGIQDAFEEVKNWKGWSEIGKFFTGIWNTIAGLFKPKSGTPIYDSTGRHETYEDSPIVAFFKSAWIGIKSAFEEVKKWSGWTAIGNFFTGIWNTIAGLFKPKMGTPIYDSTGRHETYEDSPIVAFFKSAWQGIQDAFEAVKKWKGWSEIGNFFTGVWNKISGLFKPKMGTPIYDSTGRHETYEDAPIVAFFKNAWADIKSTFEEVIGWPIWSQIGDFFSGIWDKILNFFNGSDEAVEAVVDTSKEVNEVTPTETKATEESVSLLTRIIDAISGFVERVFKAISGVDIPPEISKFFVNLTDLLKSIIGFLGEMMGHLSNLISGKASTGEWIVAGLIAIFTLLEQIFTYSNNKALAKIQTETMASKFLALGLGILAISAAISLLSTIDQGKMLLAVGAVGVMGFVIYKIVDMLNKRTALQSINAVTPTERVFTRLIGALEKVGMIAVALALLPGVIKAFGEAKKMAPGLSGEDILTTMTGIATFISSVSIGLALVDKMTGSIGLSPIGAIKTSASIVAFITILMGGLLAVAGTLDGIFGTENVISTLEQGGQMLAALGGALSGMIGGLIGGFAKGFNMIMGAKTDEEKLEDSMEILNSLGDKLEIFTTDKTAGITRILNLVGLLSQTMDDVPDATEFTKFTDSLEPLATAVMRFSLILSGFMVGENKDRIPLESMKDRVLALVEIMRAFDIPDMSTIVSSTKNKAKYFIEGIDYLSENMTPDRFKAIGSFMANIVQAFNEAMNPKGEAMKTMSGDLMKNLSDAIRIGLGDAGKYEVGVFDAMPIIDSIVTALGYGETAIATAVHNMVQAGIDAQGKSGFTLETPELIEGMAQNDLVSALLGDTLNNKDTGQTVDELTKKMSSLMYGEGGSKESPKEDSLFGTMSGFQEDMNSFEFPDMGEKLSESFSFKDPTTGENMDLAANLRETLNTFQDELNKETEFEIKIVPTFDLTKLNEASLREALGDYPVGLPLQFSMPDLMKIDFSGMAAELNMEGVRAGIDNVVSAVNVSRQDTVAAIGAMGSRIDDLGSSIRALKLYLDTGALVGGITPYIDDELGRRASYADAGGLPITSFINPFAAPATS